MSATDELRRLLDERGIKHFDYSKSGWSQTQWEAPDGNRHFTYETYNNTAKTAKLVISWFPTPEQAIAATLGTDRHPYEQRITGDGSNWAEIMADAFDDLIASAAESCTQDELAALESHIAATLGECEFVIEDNMNETEGMGDVWFRCTNCGMTYDYYADDWLMKQNYCPHCGFKIRKAVKR